MTGMEIRAGDVVSLPGDLAGQQLPVPPEFCTRHGEPATVMASGDYSVPGDYGFYPIVCCPTCVVDDPAVSEVFLVFDETGWAPAETGWAAFRQQYLDQQRRAGRQAPPYDEAGAAWDVLTAGHYGATRVVAWAFWAARPEPEPAAAKELFDRAQRLYGGDGRAVLARTAGQVDSDLTRSRERWTDHFSAAWTALSVSARTELAAFASRPDWHGLRPMSAAAAAEVVTTVIAQREVAGSSAPSYEDSRAWASPTGDSTVRDDVRSLVAWLVSQGLASPAATEPPTCAERGRFGPNTPMVTDLLDQVAQLPAPEFTDLLEASSVAGPLRTQGRRTEARQVVGDAYRDRFMTAERQAAHEALARVLEGRDVRPRDAGAITEKLDAVLAEGFVPQAQIVALSARFDDVSRP